MVALTVVQNHSEWFKIVHKLWNEMEDPPVFYSPSMLRLLLEIQSEPIELAVLEKENGAPLVALPIFPGSEIQNAHYNGWDNLKLLVANSANKSDEVEFWNLLSTQSLSIKLSCFSESQLSAIMDAKVDVISDKRRKCPYVSLGSNWGELHEKLGKKLTRNIRQYGNKAASAGITFHVQKTSEYDSELLNEKLKLAFSFHENRMEDINQKSVFSPQQAQEYHAKVLKEGNEHVCG